MWSNEQKISKFDGGFTLVELMITMVISGLIMAAIYGAYTVQQKHALAQRQVTEMQQNLRAGLDAIIRDVRLAGYSPNDLGAKIVSVAADSFEFTMDNDDGGLTTRTFELYDPLDDEADDARSLQKTASGSPVASNIQEIHFQYLDDNDDATSLISNIRTVVITMLARADNMDRNFLNPGTTYTTPPPAPIVTWGSYNDNYRRRMQTMRVKLRNMGLESE